MNEKDFSNDKDENLSSSEKDKKQSAKRPKKRKVYIDEYRYLEKINLPQTGNIEDFIDLRSYKVGINKYDLLLDDYRNATRFVLQPFFQRNFVWDNLRKSRLIESIIMGIPIPGIYSYTRQDSDDKDFKEIIIDGQQRLRTIKQFINNVFAIEGLTLNGYLNGLYFRDLPTQVKNKFLNYSLHIVNIYNVANDKIILDMFKRFNTGGVALNSQELRNCYFSGQWNNAVKELADYKTFKELFSYLDEDHMEKEECAARFLALYEDINSYTQDSQGLLDNYYCKKLKLQETNPDELTQNINKMSRVFKKAVDACALVFGKNAYKNFIAINTEDNNVKGFYRKFSKAIFDMQMLGFADIDLELISRHRNKIRSSFEKLAISSPDIKLNISNRSKKHTFSRIETWKKVVSDAVEEY
jgi:hypothetical protein